MKCHQCRKKERPKQTFTRGLCCYCYTLEANREALDRIETNFNPVLLYNKKIFQLYITQIRKKNCEIPVARKWAEVLAQEEIKCFNTWVEISNLSKKLAIRHDSEKNQGCPVLRTARILVSIGELHPLKTDDEYKIKSFLDKLPAPFKFQIEMFYLEINPHYMKRKTSINILRLIIKYFNFVSTKELFWAGEIETAQSFLDQLPSNRAAIYPEYLNALKRFFNWGLKQKLTETNPFLRISSKKVIRICEKCSQERIFRIHDKLCHQCYVDQRYRIKIEVKNASFIPKSVYNQKLYELYLKYINRFLLQTEHYRATITLQQFLSENEISPLRSWTDVTLLSRDFKERYGVKMGGCPIEKIGRMLQELSVLSIREEDSEIYLLREISNWNIDDQLLAKKYVESLRKQRRTIESAHHILKIIRSFVEWLKNECPESNLFTAQESMARNYCEILSVGSLDVHTCILNKFYRWAIREKLTLINPFAGIKTFKKVAALQICDTSIY